MSPSESSSASLSAKKCFLVFVVVFFWLLLSVVFFVGFATDSMIAPTSTVFLSALLVMLLAIKKLGGNIIETLGLYAVGLKWIVLAIVIGVIYWFVDDFMARHIFQLNQAETIKSWQQANNGYYVLSVFTVSVIMAPMFEELFFRGLVFRGLLNKYGFKHGFFVAALISSFLFAAIHWSWPGFLSLFLVALIYAVLSYKSQSVITPMIAHMTHNLITFMYYLYYPL